MGAEGRWPTARASGNSTGEHRFAEAVYAASVSHVGAFLVALMVLLGPWSQRGREACSELLSSLNSSSFHTWPCVSSPASPECLVCCSFPPRLQGVSWQAPGMLTGGRGTLPNDFTTRPGQVCPGPWAPILCPSCPITGAQQGPSLSPHGALGTCPQSPPCPNAHTPLIPVPALSPRKSCCVCGELAGFQAVRCRL